MAMHEFNYKKAWQKLSLPGWEALPQAIRDLSFAAGCVMPYPQGPSLDMAWPSDLIERGEALALARSCPLRDVEGRDCSPDLLKCAMTLKARFGEIESDLLARAARVVYTFGHWAPSVERQPLLDDAPFVSGYRVAAALQSRGGYWKFANLADQELTARLGMVRERVTTEPGIHYTVHEGAIRVGLSLRDTWQWTEVGWATKHHWDSLQAMTPPSSGSRSWRLTKWTAELQVAWDTYVADAKAKIASPDFLELTTLDAYMGSS